MGSTGFEIDAYSPTETAVDANGGAKYGAIVDSELAEVIAAWASISPADRTAIMLWVRAAVEMPTTSRRS